MKLKALTIATTVAMLTACGTDQSTEAGKAQVEAKSGTEQKSHSAYVSDTERASYGIGLNMANNVKGAPFKLDDEAIIQGVKDGLAGAEQQVSQENISQSIKALQEKYIEQQKLEREKSVKEGKDYLAENAKKPAIQVTKSGLQYEVIQSGTGRTPKATDTVKTHYHGTLISGEVFDSSVERGEPAEFQVNRVIKGWTEALQLMKEGDKWRLHIPSELAYGERSPSPKIPSNATLVFEVELLKIVDPNATQPTASNQDAENSNKETASNVEKNTAGKTAATH